MTESLLRARPSVSVVGLDLSASMLPKAADRLATFGDPVQLIEASLEDDLTPALSLLGVDWRSLNCYPSVQQTQK